MYSLLVLCVCAALTRGQVELSGACPQIQTVNNFQLDKYLGSWFEIQRYPASFQDGLDCVTAVYSVKEDGHILVNNSGINLATSEPLTALGDATVQDLSAGKLLVKFNPAQPVPGQYWILDTDYMSYAVVWSCSSYADLSLRFLWILSREPTMEPDFLAALRADVEKRGIDLHPLGSTEQSPALCKRG